MAFLLRLGPIVAVLVTYTSFPIAQEFVVFKVSTPFDMGEVVPDSGRVNDYFVKIGDLDGSQIGTVFNVYRDREIVSDIGNFKIKTRVFVGRLKALDVQEQHSLARVFELASFTDPHRDRNAVLVGDYVQPVFIVQSEYLFEKGSSNLRPEAVQDLDRGAAFIKRFKPIKVRVEGHTDSSGDAEFNLQLSQKRAETVRDYLMNKGEISDNILLPVGYGESNPIAPNDTQEGQRKNRRFEIVIER